MKIRVARNVLSDQSEVFDVLLTQDGPTLELQAVTERDAHELADGLIELIKKHTNVVIWS